MLAATPGGFQINVAETVMANVKLANNISVIINAGMALPRGTYSSELVSGVSGAPLATGPAAAGVAVLSFANAAGNVFTGNNGVLLTGVQNVVVNAGWGVISTSKNPADWKE